MTTASCVANELIPMSRAFATSGAHRRLLALHEAKVPHALTNLRKLPGI
jgi:hypothetical protein